MLLSLLKISNTAVTNSRIQQQLITVRKQLYVSYRLSLPIQGVIHKQNSCLDHNISLVEQQYLMESNSTPVLRMLTVGRIYEENQVFAFIENVARSLVYRIKVEFFFMDKKTMIKMKAKNQDYVCIQFNSQTHCLLIDYVVCVGGDGTILYAAKEFLGKPPPFITFQRGTLGFMCRFDKTEIDRVMNIVALDKTLVHPRSDELATSSILRLHTRQTFQESGQNVVTEKICLNEICIMRTNNKRIALVIYVNGEYVTETLGDGLLISTPTGSTAYSLSAGGPILQNGVNGLLIVPIAPNSLSFRPLCLSDDSVITIKLAKSTRSDAYISYDSQSTTCFGLNDTITIQRSPHNLEFLQFKNKTGNMPSWMERLRFFLGWNQKFKSPLCPLQTDILRFGPAKELAKQVLPSGSLSFEKTITSTKKTQDG